MAMTTPNSYSWLKDYVGERIPSPQEVAKLLGQHAFEIEDVYTAGDDTVIDVDVLPNRSSDCLSHRGVARELATILDCELKHDPLRHAPELPTTDLITVDIADSERCPRFTASLITGVTVKESPAWLQARLEAIGQRPINNIVDATNYVMYALGQPLHAYDADLFPQVDGAWQFVVRTARAGEVISLLSEGGKDEDRDVTLRGTETLVVDGSSDTPIGLAGVKGGRFAGVHAGTTQVIIEAASWHPTTTRKTARPLGIITDAGKRFENEVTREMALYAQAEIIALITDIAGGSLKGCIDVYKEQVENPAVTVSVSKTNALLGLELPQSEMEAILKRVGCAVTGDQGSLTAVGPWERTDLMIEEDFIEEIGRIHGYHDVTAVAPTPKALSTLNKRHYYSEVIRRVLVSAGYSEVITSSFRNKDTVQLKNALASDKSCLRSRLIPNLTETLDRNAGFTDLLGTPDTRVFEIGSVFYPCEGTVAEHISVGIGVRLKPSGYTGKEDKVLTAITDQLAAELGVAISWTIEKGVAECNLTALLKDLPEPAAYEPVVVGEEIVYQPFSIYPHVSRDIAMWVTDDSNESLTKEAVAEVLNNAAGDLRVRTTHIDEFSKDGRTSYAFRLVFQSKEKTLTDSEVNAVMDNIYNTVSERGWEVR